MVSGAYEAVPKIAVSTVTNRSARGAAEAVDPKCGAALRTSYAFSACLRSSVPRPSSVAAWR
jgi:hypothetical protein